MDNLNLGSLIDKNRIDTLFSHPGYSLTAKTVPSTLPALQEMLAIIIHDFRSVAPSLFALPAGRLRDILQHLSSLAQAPFPQDASAMDARACLQKWVFGPQTQSQKRALDIFVEELALIYLSEALLLKSWSDRGLRPFTDRELAHLNWALTQALQQPSQVVREGFEISKRSIYSWFNPSPECLIKLWNLLSVLDFSEEGPQVLESLFKTSGRFRLSRSVTYDSKLFAAVWEHLGCFGAALPSSDRGRTGTAPESLADHWAQIRMRRSVFSPTLRDGALISACPEPERSRCSWVGAEADIFLLMACELIHLWSGPKGAPLWTRGLGLLTYQRPQLAMKWLKDPKPSLELQISEMDGFDLGFVLEEHRVRHQGKSALSNEFRAEIAALDTNEDLDSKSTTLGTLQALVTVRKLRPESLLFWFREEPLSQADGHDQLRMIFEKAELVAHFDFSEVRHSIPSYSVPLAQHVYVIRKTLDAHRISRHHPERIRIRGHLRGHMEVSNLLSDAFQTLQGRSLNRGPWQIDRRTSPKAQSEWLDRWPDSAAERTYLKLEQLRERSGPLGQYASVRPLPHTADAMTTSLGELSRHFTSAFLIRVDRSGEIPRIETAPVSSGALQGKPWEFLIVPQKPHWAMVLASYLETPVVQDWLDAFAERGRGGWLLKESGLKLVPIPNALTAALDGPDLSRTDPGAARLMKAVEENPSSVRSTFENVPLDHQTSPLRAAVFVKAAQVLEKSQTGSEALFKMIDSSGTVRWGSLLSVFPMTECVRFSVHPAVRLSGSLPNHLMISRMEIAGPQSPAIVCGTESGHAIRIESQHPLVLEMLWDQMKDLTHPTWTELTQAIHLPRDIDSAHQMMSDVLKTHEAKLGRVTELKHLLRVCATF